MHLTHIWRLRSLGSAQPRVRRTVWLGYSGWVASGQKHGKEGQSDLMMGRERSQAHHFTSLAGLQARPIPKGSVNLFLMLELSWPRHLPSEHLLQGPPHLYDHTKSGFHVLPCGGEGTCKLGPHYSSSDGLPLLLGTFFTWPDLGFLPGAPPPSAAVLPRSHCSKTSGFSM